MKSVQEKRVVIGKERAGKREFVTVTDAETDEPIGSFWREDRRSPSGRPPGRTNARFTKIYDSNLAYLVDKKCLTNTEFGVLFKILRFLDWESNYLVHPETGENMSGAELARWLQEDRSDFVETLERLNKKGLLSIVKRGGPGYANHFILNTNLLFRGNHIRDIRQTDHFRGDACQFKAPVTIRHKERPKTE